MLAGACFRGWVICGGTGSLVHGSPVLRLVVTMKTESQRLFFCFQNFITVTQCEHLFLMPNSCHL